MIMDIVNILDLYTVLFECKCDIVLSAVPGSGSQQWIIWSGCNLPILSELGTSTGLGIGLSNSSVRVR